MTVQVRSTTRRARKSAVDNLGKGVVKLGNGKLLLKVGNGRDLQGKLVYKRYGPFENTPEGHAALVAQRDRHVFELANRGMESMPLGRQERVTLRAWSREWLDTDVANNNAASTLTKYERALEKHVWPFLGDVALVDLTDAMLKRWRKERQEAGLGADGVNYALKRIKTCLKAAVASKRTTGLIENPAASVDAVRVGQRKRHQSEKADYPKLMAAAAGHHLAAVIPFTLDSGLRCSEVGALHWGDIDWDNNRIWVRWHQVCSGSAKKNTVRRALVPGSKTSDGEFHDVQLSVATMALLKVHRARLRELQGPGWAAGQVSEWYYAKHSGSQSGEAYVVATDPGAEDALVFPSADGTPLQTNNLYGWFKRVCARAGVKKTFHGMRHDCGSFMLSDLVPLTVVSEHLRHANTDITATIYAHLIGDQRRLGAESMDRFWASLEVQAEVAV